MPSSCLESSTALVLFQTKGLIRKVPKNVFWKSHGSKTISCPFFQAVCGSLGVSSGTMAYVDDTGSAEISSETEVINSWFCSSKDGRVVWVSLNCFSTSIIT
ncbi:hypothetical protein Bca4012_099468 [Brassica carinata]|uniref:Uncharacterized protein n=1 Tax=Brassica carinata TaxID=52824 RepID=A0A8X7TSI7_BRACI|nr:hypothetical protein Bca52824_082092 [Brassica carinata]